MPSPTTYREILVNLVAESVKDWRPVPYDEAEAAIKALVAEKVIGESEHMQHFSFHGRSDIRDELRNEQRKVNEGL